MWWIYVLHNSQEQVSGTQVFIFTLESASDAIVLYWFGTSFHNLGSSSEDVSISYFVVWILIDLKCEFVGSMFFLINSKTSFMSSGHKPFLP